METTIHDVNKIILRPIRKLAENKEDKTSTRVIQIENSRDEILEVTCFGRSKEDLKIEIEGTEKI